jgi:hypothetical protein
VIKIAFTMSLRDELPHLLNAIARRYGEPEDYEETRPIDLLRQVDWPAPPREGESVWIIEDAGPRTVQDVQWDMETGEVRRSLDDLDTDDVGEPRVVEFLLDHGWQVDVQMMGWRSQE